MGVLEFILGIIILFVILVCFIGYIGVKFDTEKWKNENQELKDEIEKLKARKSRKKEDK